MPCFSSDDEYKRMRQLTDHDHAIADLLCRVLTTLQGDGMSGQDIRYKFGIDVSMWWHGHQGRDCSRKNAERLPPGRHGNANQRAAVVFNKNMMEDGALVIVIGGDVVGHIKPERYAHLLNDYFDASQLRAIAEKLESMTDGEK